MSPEPKSQAYGLNAADRVLVVEDALRHRIFRRIDLLAKPGSVPRSFSQGPKPKFLLRHTLPWNWHEGAALLRERAEWAQRQRMIDRQEAALAVLDIARDIWSKRGRINAWHSADGYTFERLAAASFRRLGWKVKAVGGSNDGGVDLRIRKDGFLTLVQCKAHAKPISPSVLRELMGAISHEDAAGGLLLCLNGITPSGREWIKDKPIRIMTPTDLLRMGG